MVANVGPRRVVVALVAGLCIWVTAATASAQEHPDADFQNFEPELGPHAVFTTHTSGTLNHLQPAGQVVFDYSSEPLVEEVGSTTEPIVDQQLKADLLAGIGLLEDGQVAIHLPVYLLNNVIFEESDLSSATVGDLSIEPKYTILEAGPVGLAGAVDVSFPTGRGEAFVGVGHVTAEPKLVADVETGKTTVAGNFGFRIQPRGELRNVGLGHEFTYRFGVEYQFIEGLIHLDGELFGHTLASNFFGASEESPLEILFGADVLTDPGFVISAGMGGGLVSGVGAPEFRAVLGVGYPGSRRDGDPDGDDIEDDQCPNEAEDLDGFEDQDGCPDPDNDGDGIPDDEDECPDEAEDLDGSQDDDGCPDPDNDGDGIPDKEDDCPEKPEDRDGFEDDDGCPDPDNDGDGIPDDEDECPDEAEDKDGVADDDGCPEEDDDRDGIANAEDDCPDEPGLRVNDGCPPEEELVTLKEQEGRIEIHDKIYFETDKAILREKSYETLDAVALVLRTHPDIDQIQIQGHTDDTGEKEYNQKLSERRAESVLEYLVKKGEIDRDRLEAKGFGASQPVVPNTSDENRAKNRRVVFQLPERAGDDKGEPMGEADGDDEGTSGEDSESAENPEAGEEDGSDEASDSDEAASSNESGGGSP